MTDLFNTVKSMRISITQILISASLMGLSLLPGMTAAGEITPELLSRMSVLKANQRVPVIIRFNNQPTLLGDISGASAVKDQRLRRARIIRTLRRNTGLSQKELRTLLQQQGIGKLRELWIINALAVEVPVSMVDDLSLRPEVKSIRLDATVTVPDVNFLAAPSYSNWNTDMINASVMWGSGYTGSGAVIGIIDSGVDILHAALAPGWRGGSNSWFDPFGTKTQPYDGSSEAHGTGVAGIMLAREITGQVGDRAIGVAPDATWIAARFVDDLHNSGSLSVIHQTMQWMLDPDGNPATDDAPDVINASWAIGSLHACNQEFDTDIGLLQAADIPIIYAAGNSGPSNNTDESPANNPAVISVGAVDMNSALASFSARGPSACDANAVFPTLVAPGVGDLTTGLITTFTTSGGLDVNATMAVEGTSFSAPHVAGAIALIRGAMPYMPATDIEDALRNSASPLGSGLDAGFGYGLVDVMAAYNSLLAGDVDSDGDGVKSGQDCNDNDPAIVPGAVEGIHDGVDQNCNGIEILKAVHRSKPDILLIEARNDTLGVSAMMTVSGYGDMTWLPKKSKWQLRIKGAGGPPLSQLTISDSTGNSETVTVVRR